MNIQADSFPVDLVNYVAIEVLESLGHVAPSQEQIDRVESVLTRMFLQLQAGTALATTTELHH